MCLCVVCVCVCVCATSIHINFVLCMHVFICLDHFMHVYTYACTSYVCYTCNARAHTHTNTLTHGFLLRWCSYIRVRSTAKASNRFLLRWSHTLARTHTHLCLRLSFSLSHSLTLPHTHTRDCSKQRSHATRFSHANPGE